MSETIEIEVCNWHGSIHPDLKEVAGDQYEEKIRSEVEELIHNFYREIERKQEQQQAQQTQQVPPEVAQAMAQSKDGDDEEESADGDDPRDIVDEVDDMLGEADE